MVADAWGMMVVSPEALPAMTLEGVDMRVEAKARVVSKAMPSGHAR